MSQLDLSLVGSPINLKALFGPSGTELCQMAACEFLMAIWIICVAFSHNLGLPALS